MLAKNFGQIEEIVTRSIALFYISSHIRQRPRYYSFESKFPVGINGEEPEQGKYKDCLSPMENFMVSPKAENRSGVLSRFRSFLRYISDLILALVFIPRSQLSCQESTEVLGDQHRNAAQVTSTIE